MERNSKILIIAGVFLSIIIGISLISIKEEPKDVEEQFIVNSTITKEIPDEIDKTDEQIEKEIEKKYEEISNYNADVYTPKERTWISSGPFKIDREEYRLGDKIFLIMEGLSFEERGNVVFLRPLNDTHYSVWTSYPFDGMKKDAFNVYFEPKLSERDNICNVNDLIGQWKIVFRGTDYDNLGFIMTNSTIPGDEERFKPIC